MDQAIMNKWNFTNGAALQSDYKSLNENSIVFDVGGYLGEWTENIVNKYNCTVYIFEPVKKFYDSIVEKYKDNPKIKPFNIGLSDKHEKIDINVLDAASSTQSAINGTRGTEVIELRSITDFIKEHKIKHIHLIKINIEGDEFDLLNNLIDTSMVNIIGNIQVQFHDFVKDAYRRRHEIAQKLMKTHRCTWNMDFIWENWEVIYDTDNKRINPINLEPNLLKFIK